MTEREFAELSAAYALGALTPAEERQYREELDRHPEWRPLADLDIETAATLADGIAAAPPPADLRDRLILALRDAAQPEPAEESRFGDEAAQDAEGVDDTVPVAAPPVAASGLAARPVEAAVSEPEVQDAPPRPASMPAPPPVPAPEEAARRAAGPPTEVVQAIQRRNWTRGVIGLVGAIVVLVGIGWAVGAITDAIRTPEAEKVLSQIERAEDARMASGEYGETGGAVVHWADSVGKAVIVARGLPDLDHGQEFEAWIVRDDQPASAASFEAPDGEAIVLLDEPMDAAATLIITIEQAGGADGGSPTTDPLITIEPVQEPAEP